MFGDVAWLAGEKVNLRELACIFQNYLDKNAPRYRAERIRKIDVFTLRMDGFKFVKIGEKLGLTSQRVHTDFTQINSYAKQALTRIRNADKWRKRAKGRL